MGNISRINIIFTGDVEIMLREFAKKNNLSMSAVVRLALKEYIKKYDKDQS